MGFGAMDASKPYKIIWFGDIHGPKTYKFIGFRCAFISQTPLVGNIGQVQTVRAARSGDAVVALRLRNLNIRAVNKAGPEVGFFKAPKSAYM